MGRLAGFLCGTTLTLLSTHLLLTQHRAHTSAISSTLRESQHILDSLQYPPAPVELLRPRIARPSLIETMKDAWNYEVEKGVRWVQSWDLVRFREGVEEVGEAVGGRLWNMVKDGVQGGERGNEGNEVNGRKEGV